MKDKEVLEIADKYAGAACTLNGQPATVKGRLCDFATVVQLAGGLGCDWSWQAVERVMLAGGNFKS